MFSSQIRNKVEEKELFVKKATEEIKLKKEQHQLQLNNLKKEYNIKIDTESSRLNTLTGTVSQKKRNYRTLTIGSISE